jgi:ubiquitin carboxyl-terminal hydrolase L3
MYNLKMNSNSHQWPPLESDPEIFNEYFHKLGADSSIFFKELLSLDYKEFFEVEGPIVAVILNFERGPNPTLRKPDNILTPAFVPFFMKQTSELDNACGLIAGLHALGNTVDFNLSKVTDNSIIKRFFDQAKPVDWEQRGKILEGFNDFKTAHGEFANQGQSSIPDDVKNHYICFINYQDSIVELDGMTPGPYVVKDNVNESDFLYQTTQEIMRRVKDGEIGEGLSVMFIGNENTKVVDMGF